MTSKVASVEDLEFFFIYQSFFHRSLCLVWIEKKTECYRKGINL